MLLRSALEIENAGLREARFILEPAPRLWILQVRRWLCVQVKADVAAVAAALDTKHGGISN